MPRRRRSALALQRRLRGVDDPIGVTLLGEEALTVLREVGVHRVPGHDRAEARRAVLRVASAGHPRTSSACLRRSSCRTTPPPEAPRGASGADPVPAGEDRPPAAARGPQGPPVQGPVSVPPSSPSAGRPARSGHPFPLVPAGPPLPMPTGACEGGREPGGAGTVIGRGSLRDPPRLPDVCPSGADGAARGPPDGLRSAAGRAGAACSC